jgi:hypothetical protein
LQQSTAVEAAIRDRELKLSERHTNTAVARAQAGQRFIELPGRGIGAGMTAFAEAAGDGADTLGKFGDKLRDTERSTFWQATKQMFGMGPFNRPNSAGAAASMLGPMGRPGFDMKRMRQLFPQSSMDFDVRGNAALERGTAAAFSQERRSSQQNQLIQQARQQTELLKKTVHVLEQIEGKNLGAELLPANVA